MASEELRQRILDEGRRNYCEKKESCISIFDAIPIGELGLDDDVIWLVSGSFMGKVFGELDENADVDIFSIDTNVERSRNTESNRQTLAEQKSFQCDYNIWYHMMELPENYPNSRWNAYVLKTFKQHTIKFVKNVSVDARDGETRLIDLPLKIYKDLESIRVQYKTKTERDSKTIYQRIELNRGLFPLNKDLITKYIFSLLVTAAFDVRSCQFFALQHEGEWLLFDGREPVHTSVILSNLTNWRLQYDRLTRHSLYKLISRSHRYNALPELLLANIKEEGEQELSRAFKNVLMRLEKNWRERAEQRQSAKDLYHNMINYFMDTNGV